MKRVFAASLIALAPAVHAAGGAVDVFYVPKAEFELDGGSSPLGSGEDDGDGFGVKAQFNVLPQLAITGEYRSTSTDEDVDVDQYRIGGLFLVQGQSGIGAEYLSNTVDIGGEIEQSGFFLNGRLAGDVSPQISLYGQIGYLINGSQDFSDLGGPEDEDAKGLELGFGGVYNLNKQFGVLVDWRRTQIEGEDFEVELTDTDISVGVRIIL